MGDVVFTCDLSGTGEPFPHFWEQTPHAVAAVTVEFAAAS